MQWGISNLIAVERQLIKTYDVNNSSVLKRPQFFCSWFSSEGCVPLFWKCWIYFSVKYSAVNIFQCLALHKKRQRLDCRLGEVTLHSLRKPWKVPYQICIFQNVIISLTDQESSIIIWIKYSVGDCLHLTCMCCLNQQKLLLNEHSSLFILFLEGGEEREVTNLLLCKTVYIHPYAVNEVPALFSVLKSE